VQLGALASEMAQEVIFGDNGSPHYRNKAGDMTQYSGRIPTAKELTVLIGKKGPQVQIELANLKDSSGKDYFSTPAQLNEFTQFLQYRGRLNAQGEVGLIGRLAINTAAQAEGIKGTPVSIAADGAVNLAPAEVQNKVDNRITQLKTEGVTPRVWGRTQDGQRFNNGQEYQQSIDQGKKIDYVYFEYTDAQARDNLGRDGLGYRAIGETGERITSLVYNGNQDTRLHEIGELRVNRQKELMQEGWNGPEEIKNLLNTMTPHQVSENFLGYKGQPSDIWQPDVKLKARLKDKAD
jgi:hypothetical protein